MRRNDVQMKIILKDLYYMTYDVINDVSEG